MLLSTATNGYALRGLGLWLLLLAAVLVRETARGLGGVAVGLAPPSRLLLLPMGAAPQADESGVTLSPLTERLLALVGPLANFFAGITLALLMYAATPNVNLFERPWFGPAHLVRAAIWSQVLLGGLNLLPALPLDAGILLRNQLRRMRGNDVGARSAAGISQVVALLLIAVGFALANGWVGLMGCLVLLTGRAESRAALAVSATETVTVGDVMLREFSTIAASDTLEDALRGSAQSLQEIFPVVRGTLVVGSVSRDALLLAMHSRGNAYVQSAMNRTVETVSPDDLLLPTLRRVQAHRNAQLLHVVRGRAGRGHCCGRASAADHGSAWPHQSSAAAGRPDEPTWLNLLTHHWRPGCTWWQRPSATWKTSPCAPCACCGRSTGLPVRTPGRPPNCCITTASGRRPSAITCTTSRVAQKTWSHNSATEAASPS